MSDPRSRINPLLFSADHVVSYAIDLWTSVRLRAFQVILRKPQPDTETVDRALEEDVRRVEAESEHLFELKKALPRGDYQSRLPPELAEVEKLVEEFVRDALVVAMRARATVGALATVGDNYAGRKELDADLRQAREELEPLRAQVRAACERGTEAGLRARIAEAVERLGISIEEATAATHRRWR